MLEECFLLLSTGVSCMVSSRFTVFFCVTSFVSLNLELPHGINSLEVSLAERDSICLFVFELRILAEIRIKVFYDAQYVLDKK